MRILILVTMILGSHNLYSQEPINVAEAFHGTAEVLTGALSEDLDSFDLGDLSQRRNCLNIGDLIEVNQNGEAYEVIDWVEEHGNRTVRVRKIKSGDSSSLRRIKAYGVEYNSDERTNFHIGVGKVKEAGILRSTSSTGGFFSIKIVN